MFFQWKKADRPGPQHPLSIQRRVAKKHLRSTQRRQKAAYRSTVYQDIMAADSSNKKLFFSLVNRKRKDGFFQLFVDDRHLTIDEAIREGWASYFERMAAPVDDHTYNEGFEPQDDLDFDLI